eukprot:CAMPEP_0115832096 /NCGR_PEP_ID=MMETSP0287-20121206/2480_1 /TAXON_ID=412157 /ORGANISM="Chrysochromulina rotalis, Strain UIO044" /LENGTH=68 /DNA_ID=CAMNT_0003285467 /DNA_START=57 /DNA_END=263 /DNA_ORIENTATION=+
MLRWMVSRVPFSFSRSSRTTRSSSAILSDGDAAAAANPLLNVPPLSLVLISSREASPTPFMAAKPAAR